MFFEKKIELGRNENWIFYKTDLTISACKYAMDKWKLEDVAAIYAEEIVVGEEVSAELFDIDVYIPRRAYLLVNPKNRDIIKDFTSYESLLYHIDFIGISRTFDK